MRIIYLALSVVLCITACNNISSRHEFRIRPNENEYIELDLDLKHATFIKPCAITEKVEFIPLETNSECIIGSYDKIIVVKDSIYILDKTTQQAIFVFNKKGQFLYKINSIGRGPGEYVRAYDFYVDTVGKHIGILDYGRVQKYDFNGNYIDRVLFSGNLLAQIFYSFNRYYAVCFPGFSHDKTYIFAAFDSIGNLIYRDHPTENYIISYEGSKSVYFSANSDGVFFNDYGSDTIYNITDSYLNPAFVFNWGKSAVPPEIKKQLYQKPYEEVVNYFKRNENMNWLGIEEHSMSDDYLILRLPYGHKIYNAIYSLKSHSLKFINDGGHISLLYPRGEIIFFEGRAIASVPAAGISNCVNYSDNFGPIEDEEKSPWYYKNVKGYDTIKASDNNIITIFSLKEF